MRVASEYPKDSSALVGTASFYAKEMGLITCGHPVASTAAEVRGVFTVLGEKTENFKILKVGYSG